MRVQYEKTKVFLILFIVVSMLFGALIFVGCNNPSDSFQIVAEQNALSDTTIMFDRIKIVGDEIGGLYVFGTVLIILFTVVILGLSGVTTYKLIIKKKIKNNGT